MRKSALALALLATVAACSTSGPTASVVLSDAAKLACAGQAAANATSDALAATHNAADAASAAQASALLGKACVWGAAVAPIAAGS